MVLLRAFMVESNPFADGRGLVGGRGADRAPNRRAPPLLHRTILRPFDVETDIAAGRTFFADSTVEVEIGFGRGHFLRDRLLQAPDHRYLGFEVRRLWCQRLAKFLERNELDNTRVILADARPLLMDLFEPGQVAAFYVFFPDPWWKKRHHKRRVMSTDTLNILHTLLASGGQLHFRTDVAAYFEVVHALVSDHDGFEFIEPRLAADGTTLPQTHRDKKCSEFGINVQALCARKTQEIA